MGCSYTVIWPSHQNQESCLHSFWLMTKYTQISGKWSSYSQTHIRRLTLYEHYKFLVSTLDWLIIDTVSLQAQQIDIWSPACPHGHIKPRPYLIVKPGEGGTILYQYPADIQMTIPCCFVESSLDSKAKYAKSSRQHTANFWQLGNRTLPSGVLWSY